MKPFRRGATQQDGARKIGAATVERESEGKLVGAMAGLRPKTPRRYGASGPTHEFRLAELQFRGLTVNEKFESEGVSTPAPRGGGKSHLMRVAAIM
jgi:hypothetical protein